MSHTLTPECVREFNRLLHKSGAAVVLSSAWRYMIHGGAITTKGFEYLLRTHGVVESVSIVGITCKDEECEGRGRQIRAWLREHPTPSYVVLDDDEHDIASEGHPFIRTVGDSGLTMSDVDAALALLSGKGADHA